MVHSLILLRSAFAGSAPASQSNGKDNIYPAYSSTLEKKAPAYDLMLKNIDFMRKLNGQTG